MQDDHRDFDSEAAVRRLGPLLYEIGRKVLAIQKSGDLAVEEKENFADIVTRADKLSESLLTDHIKEHYPGHSIRGEEGTNVVSGSGFQWFIDPIDGTTNFAKGMEFFGISLGLYKDRKGKLGIMYFPALGKFVYAVKGAGVYLNTERIRIRGGAKRMKDALIVADLRRGREKLLFSLRGNSMNVLTAGSFTAESLWLIEGKTDAQFHTGATPYDIAAASIIVEEAGGVVTGFYDKIINLDEEHIPIILSRTPELASELQEFLKK